MKTKEKQNNMKQYLSKHKFGIMLYILINLLVSGSDIALTLFAANMIQVLTEGIYKEAIILLLISMGLFILRRVLYYLTGLIYQILSKKILSEINLDLSKQAFKLNSKTYADHGTGEFVQRIINDPARTIDQLTNIIDVSTDLISSLVIIIYLTTLNIWIGLSIILIIALGIIIELFRTKINYKNKLITQKKNDEVYSLTTEIVRSEKDIKSLGLEDKLSDSIKQKYKEYQAAVFKTSITNMSFFQIRNVLIEVASVLILIMGVYFKEKSLISLATFMIIYSYRSSISGFIWRLSNLLQIFSEVKVGINRMFQLFDEKEFVTERFGKKHLDNVVGKIEFKNVGFTFIEYEKVNNKLTKKERKILKNKPQKRKIISKNRIFNNLSFTIRPNSTVAFVGRSGSGKSTILNLMSKMYEVNSGKVLIDGVDIKKLDKETLRKNISLVNQFPYIFDMTIKENLLLAKKDATDEEINQAIEDAALKPFVDSLKNGVETRVGESGIKLSGGQKQRLAIARAFLRKSAITIFDESTSSLDNFAQEEVKQSIDKLKGKSTIVIVAHRLSTVRDVDKIFFLENGEIQDVGSFYELFENNSKFRSMFYAEESKN